MHTEMEESKEMLNEPVEPMPQPVNNEDTIPDSNPETQMESTDVKPVEPAATAEVAPAEEPAVAEEPAPVETPAEAPAAEAAPATEEPVAAPEEAPEEAETEEAPEAKETEPVVDYSDYSRDRLVSALHELLQEEDITKIKNRVAAIRVRFNVVDKEVKDAAFQKFIEEGGNKEDYQGGDDAVAETFRNEYQIYRERRQKHIDELEAQKQKNLEAKKAILEDLRTLIDRDSESLKQTYDDFNAIQDRWKNIGDVPRSEVNGLWQNYHFLVEQFFNKVKINKELILLDQKKNLEKKTLLCEKAEELIVETSIVKAFKELQNLREQWREVGPVPVEQNDEIWTRFRTAAARIDERRKEYYDQRHEEQEKNLLAKQALVEKVKEVTAETPSGVKMWNDVSAQLEELLKVWKSIGPVPKEHNEEIWHQFKGTIDQFFAQKKEFFDNMKNEQSENYNKKINLCLQAEAIAKRDDWKKATEEILQLQKEWKEAGAVNRKMSDKLWHRFRAACDEFFNAKTEYYNNLHGSEQENLQKKEAILSELKAASFGEDKEENLNLIKDFQRRWMEAGHVPIAEKDRIQKEFRDTINGLFEQLQISAREAETAAFRARVRNTMSSGNAVSGERGRLEEQIQHLQSDINLWENNLGFLANSKQAELLKTEFERKMQQARQQIALLQAKVKILDEAANAPKEEPKAEAAPEAPAAEPEAPATDENNA